jgi:hypothetical protein
LKKKSRLAIEKGCKNSMKKRLIIVLEIILLGSFIAGSLPYVHAQIEYPIIESIPSPSLGPGFFGNADEQNVSVFLPNNYNSAKNTFYPVIYITSSFGLDEIALLVKYNYISQDYSDAITVVALVSHCGISGDMPMINSPVTGNWGDYLVQDVVPFIDDHYRTIQSAAARAFVSQNYFSTAINHPDVFQVVVGENMQVTNPEGIEPQLHHNKYLLDSFLMQKASFEAEIATLSTADEKLAAYKTELTRLYFGIPAVYNNIVDVWFYSWGLLIAPNISREGIYIDFPYYKNGTENVPIEALTDLWDNRFVNLSEAINAEQAVLTELDIGIFYTIDWNGGIPIYVDIAPDFRWIEEGNDYLCDLMDEADISYEAEKIPYTPTVQLYKDYIFPFCSTHLEPMQKQGFSVSGYPLPLFGVGMIFSIVAIVFLQNKRRN